MLLVRPLFARFLGLFLESNTSAEIRLMCSIERLKSYWVEIRNITCASINIQHIREDASRYCLEKNWESYACKLFYILIRNWVKSNDRAWHASISRWTKHLLHYCFSRENDKRPCDMLFNSRTDIRHINQGPMEIFDETSRKKE